MFIPQVGFLSQRISNKTKLKFNFVRKFVFIFKFLLKVNKFFENSNFEYYNNRKISRSVNILFKYMKKVIHFKQKM